MFEPGDHLDLKYKIVKQPKPDFMQYMQFLNEAYKSDGKNLENEFNGTWKFKI